MKLTQLIRELQRLESQGHGDLIVGAPTGGWDGEIAPVAPPEVSDDIMAGRDVVLLWGTS